MLCGQTGLFHIGAVEEGDDLPPGADAVWGEGGGGCAAGHALVYRPGHRLSVVRSGRNISEAGFDRQFRQSGNMGVAVVVDGCIPKNITGPLTLFLVALKIHIG